MTNQENKLKNKNAHLHVYFIFLDIPFLYSSFQIRNSVEKLALKNFTSHDHALYFFPSIKILITFRPTHHPNNKNIEKRSNDSISRFQFEALPSVYIFLVESGHEAGRMA